MSFFADIIADSRRQIVSGHRSELISGSMPVQVNAANPSNPSGSEFVSDSITGNDEGNNKNIKTDKPETTLPVTSAQPQTSPVQISTPSVPRTAETDDHVLQDSAVTSTSILEPDSGMSQLNTPVVPTVQLKVAYHTQNDQPYSASPKMTDPVSSDVNAGHNKKTSDTSTSDAVEFTTKQIDQIDPKLAQFVEKRRMRTKTSSAEQNVLKPDGIAQASSGMTPDNTENSTVISVQSRREDDQLGAEAFAAFAVSTAAQVESTAVHTRPINAPVVHAGHIKDTVSQQSRVQIGQVNVVIEQAAAPRRRASAVTGNGDYASRNFLKSL